jgi:hypothetical protein
LKEIRSKPASLEEDHMKIAAQHGPLIVVNLCPHGAQAFIVQAHKIRLLDLPLLSVQDVNIKAESLHRARSTAALHDMYPILEWLWDTVCQSVLKFLRFTKPCSESNTEWPHIWWIPTGPLTVFPFHAAGYHQRKSGETVIDRVISLYATSIKSLIDTRRRRPQPSVTPDSFGLIASMPEPPGHNRLPFSDKEVALLNDLWPQLQLQIIRPVNSRKKDVLEHLRDCHVFHFAGHGHANPMDPSKSALLLDDWETDPLTVRDLRNENLHAKQPFFAYLSASSTASINKKVLMDEAIHPISILQLAGFRHAVGTLWEVSDPHCVDVARVLYETLRDLGLTDKAVSLGLHRAIRAMIQTERLVEESVSRKGTLKLKSSGSLRKAQYGDY